MSRYMKQRIGEEKLKARESRIMHRGELYYCYNRAEDVETGSELRLKNGRPCILVSKEDLCNHSPVVSVVYLTERPKTDYPTHVVITSNSFNSTAICEQVMSVSKSRLGDVIGTISTSELSSIDRAIAEAYELDYLIGTSNDSSKVYEELLVAKTERDTYKRMVDTFIKSTSK